MQLFYTPVIEGNTAVLGEEESWHCTRVLRLAEGAPIRLTDGHGRMYEGRLSRVHPKNCLVDIDRTTAVGNRRPWRLHVAMAPTKNIDRFEWFLEKATEIGIDEITPLICEHSERRVLKLARLEKVLIAAMKQSLKSWLPVLNEPVEFNRFIADTHPGQKFIAWCETGRESELQQVCIKGSGMVVMVGPEGDFSPSETTQAMKSGFEPVSLGEYRLRTETAGIVVCNMVEFLNRI